MKTAILPGSFDPITVGHLDLAQRAAAMFDRVILCVMVNGEKHPMFTTAERLELAKAAVSHLPNVEAMVWEGLLVDLAREQGACALVKGARGCTDFDWEFQLAQINRDLLPGLDTVILPARPALQHISSTMVREMIRYDRKLDDYVPAAGLDILRKMKKGKVR